MWRANNETFFPGKFGPPPALFVGFAGSRRWIGSPALRCVDGERVLARSRGMLRSVLLGMGAPPSPSWLPLELTSAEYRDAVGRVSVALQRCQAELIAVPSSADRRRLRVPDECWNALRATISELTRLARTSGEYPEHALLRMKEIANSASPSLDRESPLRAAVVKLCIETYFADHPNSPIGGGR